jgi:hypothetical protein
LAIARATEIVVNTKLEEILKEHPTLWHGQGIPRHDGKGIPTGFQGLDAVLPGGGWPPGALVDIVTEHRGIGELGILLPAMARLCGSGLQAVWIDPSFIPYAPTLRQAGVNTHHVLIVGPCRSEGDIPWCMEKILRSASCGMAMAWPRQLDFRATRRLQLAAEAGGSLGFLFHATDPGNSPTALRICLSPRDGALVVRIAKARGTLGRTVVELPR